MRVRFGVSSCLCLLALACRAERPSDPGTQPDEENSGIEDVGDGGDTGETGDTAQTDDTGRTDTADTSSTDTGDTHTGSTDSHTGSTDTDTGSTDTDNCSTDTDTDTGSTDTDTDSGSTDTDTDPTVLIERCDGLDNDGDGLIDEDAVDAVLAYIDADGDGYGDVDEGTWVCEWPLDAVADGSDCDDDVAWVYPGAEEWCDGIDTDCDGELDAGGGDAFTWFADADGDYYGDISVAITQCAEPPGYVPDLSDCDDGDATVAPDQVETCNGIDDDCSGVVDDNDGTCDGDEPVPDACTLTWHPDLDADAAGDPTVSVTGCQPDASWVTDDGDCDDADALIAPGADETCNGLDDDCDGDVDDGALDAGAWFGDSDGDGYGTGADFERTCTAPAGYSATAGDCDDADPAVSPDAVETCDGIDNNCELGVDEVTAVDTLEWYVDTDLDGWAGTRTRSACTRPLGTSETLGDCDDDDDGVFPGAAEVCNDADDDCNGLTDDATSVGAGWWYADADEDEFGDATMTLWSCSTPSGYVEDDTDCDDGDAGVFPGRREMCDGEDDNCDGAIDEAGAAGESRYYVDADGDGAGHVAGWVEACDMPAGYVVDYDDCDDADAASFPGNPEVCGDGIDNDCDGVSALCGPWGERDVSLADAYFDGEAPGNVAGGAVTFLGDVDGDGLDDLGIGGSGHDGVGNESGVVWVVTGAPSGSQPLGGSTARLLGVASSDRAGFSLAAIGDADGDGNADVFVGAYTEATGGSQAGGAYVVAGPVTGDVSLASARLHVYGGTASDWAGYSVAAGGDHDADGTPDLAVGAPYEDQGGSKAGAVYVGSAAGTGTVSLEAGAPKRYGELGLDRAGSAVAYWDADGDGLSDLLVGAWGESSGGARAGAVYLVHGPITGTASLATADERWRGERAGTRAGATVAAVGDVDGDGLADALVGAPWGTNAYLLGAASMGATSLTAAVAIFEQEDNGSRLGGGVGGGGDVDGDGLQDIVIGAWGENSGGAAAGAAYLWRGPLSGAYSLADADGKLVGQHSDALLGSSVSINGDADGDGFSDVLVGSPGGEAAGFQAGAAWLFYGMET